MTLVRTRPEPLVLREDGRTVSVTTPALWARQRRALPAQVEHWIFGKMPPAPDNLHATDWHGTGRFGRTLRQCWARVG